MTNLTKIISQEPLPIYENGQLSNITAFRAHRALKMAHRAYYRTREIVLNARELIDDNRM